MLIRADAHWEASYTITEVVSAEDVIGWTIYFGLVMGLRTQAHNLKEM